MTKNSVKEAAIQILSGLGILAVVVAIYFFSSKTGGSLTSVEPCTTSYIKGDFSLDTLKSQCPNLDKEDVKKAINEYFDGSYSYAAHSSRQEMLDDVDSHF